MITERTLRRWRRDALIKPTTPVGLDALSYIYSELEEANDRILRMTQELLDQHLLRKEKK